MAAVYIKLDRKSLFLTINYIPLILAEANVTHVVVLVHFLSVKHLHLYCKAIQVCLIEPFVLVVLPSCCNKVLFEPVQPARLAALPPLLLQPGLSLIQLPPSLSVFSSFSLVFHIHAPLIEQFKEPGVIVSCKV